MNLLTSESLNVVLQNLLKYLIEGLAVAMAAFYIPRGNMKVMQIVVIGVTAAATFAVLDLYAPRVSGAARQGAGYGIGAGITGMPVPLVK